MEQLICIIEDDEGIQDVLTIILKSAGYETQVYPSGKAIMENNYAIPDLFLIDKQLPDIDGLLICKHLKQERLTSAIPIIMMSAFPNARQLSVESGADDFIEKPFQLENLISTIKKYISSETVA